jgi:hypothetical protein
MLVYVNIATSQAQFKIPITATNSTSNGTVEIGWDRSASHCVDASLGETELPPKPPSEVFDIRLLDNRTPSCLGEGVSIDLRNWVESVSVTDTFVITIQQGSGGLPVTLTWPTISNPQIGSLILQDGLGGILVNTNMLTAQSQVVSNSLLLTLNIYATVTNRVKEEGGLPTSFGLQQNYPNPFNPTTNLKFSVPEKSDVEIAVFDMLGRKISTLVSENLAANVYSVEWNGRNDNGTALASGVYNIRMVANSELGKTFTDVRKVVLMK